MPVIRVEVPAGTPADTQKTIRTAVKAAVLKTLAPKETNGRVTHTNQAPEFPARFRRVRADTPGSWVKKRQGSMNDGRRLFRMEPCNGGSRNIDRPPDLPDMPRRFTRDNNDCGTARRALIPRPRTGFRSKESIPC